MKIYILLGVLLLAGCEASMEVNNFEECMEAGYDVMESHPRQCSDGENVFYEELSDYASLCEERGGTYLEEHGECEYVSEDFCDELGGEFYECESACRHDPDYPDVICTMQCVPVCVLN